MSSNPKDNANHKYTLQGLQVIVLESVSFCAELKVKILCSVLMFTNNYPKFSYVILLFALIWTKCLKGKQTDTSKRVAKGLKELGLLKIYPEDLTQQTCMTCAHTQSLNYLQWAKTQKIQTATKQRLVK